MKPNGVLTAILLVLQARVVRNYTTPTKKSPHSGREQSRSEAVDSNFERDELMRKQLGKVVNCALGELVRPLAPARGEVIRPCIERASVDNLRRKAVPGRVLRRSAQEREEGDCEEVCAEGVDSEDAVKRVLVQRVHRFDEGLWISRVFRHGGTCSGLECNGERLMDSRSTAATDDPGVIEENVDIGARLRNDFRYPSRLALSATIGQKQSRRTWDCTFIPYLQADVCLVHK